MFRLWKKKNGDPSPDTNIVTRSRTHPVDDDNSLDSMAEDTSDEEPLSVSVNTTDPVPVSEPTKIQKDKADAQVLGTSQRPADSCTATSSSSPSTSRAVTFAQQDIPKRDNHINDEELQELIASLIVGRRDHEERVRVETGRLRCFEDLTDPLRPKAAPEWEEIHQDLVWQTFTLKQRLTAKINADCEALRQRLLHHLAQDVSGLHTTMADILDRLKQDDKQRGDEIDHLEEMLEEAKTDRDVGLAGLEKRLRKLEVSTMRRLGALGSVPAFPLQNSLELNVSAAAAAAAAVDNQGRAESWDEHAGHSRAKRFHGDCEWCAKDVTWFETK